MKLDRTYKKELTPLGNGWDHRPPGRRPSSLVVHTTNGNKGSTFKAEMEYLVNSPAVGAHAGVGKSGQVVQLLPWEERAWHAGATIEGFSNSDSIGIECHFTPGEVWTIAQERALTELAQFLISTYQIPLWKVETHRRVAVPEGRKQDPSSMTNADFYAWRSTLAAPAPALLDMQVIGVAQPRATLTQVKASMLANKAPLAPVEIDRIYRDAVELNIEPSFVVALWLAEAGRPLGGSALQQQSRCPINIKVPDVDWPGRDTVRYDGSRWAAFESFQLGAFQSLIHLKQVHGAHGRYNVRDIIPVHAPATDRNDPERIIASVLEDMRYIQAR